MVIPTAVVISPTVGITSGEGSDTFSSLQEPEIRIGDRAGRDRAYNHKAGKTHEVRTKLGIVTSSVNGGRGVSFTVSDRGV